MFAFPANSAVRAATLALVLIAPAATALAQQPSAAAIAVAKEVVIVKGAGALFDPLVAGVIEKAKGMFLQTNPMLANPLNEVAAKLKAEYAARSADIINDVAKLYAMRFSEKELKEVLAFYKSPLGRKMIEEEPKILDQGMRDARAWADRFSEEVIKKMRAEMRKRGHEI
jgi:hypothetical protein